MTRLPDDPMLSDLYQEVILDHNRRPRHYGPLTTANRHADGANPLCGDKLSIALQLDGDRIAEIRFEGSGCAISKASASLMSEAVSGRTLPEVLALFERFHDVLTTPADQDVDTDDLGKLAAFAGVRGFPVRVKCATLAWHTLKAALDGGSRASTE
jgi:nitrogen fixation NifU-like protein